MSRNLPGPIYHIYVVDIFFCSWQSVLFVSDDVLVSSSMYRITTGVAELHITELCYNVQPDCTATTTTTSTGPTITITTVNNPPHWTQLKFYFNFIKNSELNLQKCLLSIFEGDIVELRIFKKEIMEVVGGGLRYLVSHLLFSKCLDI